MNKGSGGRPDRHSVLTLCVGLLGSLYFAFDLCCGTLLWDEVLHRVRNPIRWLPEFPLARITFLTTFGHMELLERITVEPGKCGGRPCIRGFRIRVSDVLDLIASGASNEEILTDYPFLEADDIVAALTYAARQTDHAVIAGAA